MKTCPFHAQTSQNGAPKLRPELPPLTPRIAALPIDDRGYPVPFFVQWFNDKNEPTKPGEGRPEFRMADPSKVVRCVKEKLCWVCGQPLGAYLCFPIGPMCAVNRTTAEPPSHLDCAEWSVMGCPFLSRPNMVRREDDLTEANEGNVAGEMIKRNPGVTCLWVTKDYRMFRDHVGRPLFQVGLALNVTWWREGRPATRLEVLESITSGLPRLLELCQDPEEADALNAALQHVKHHLLPAA